MVENQILSTTVTPKHAITHAWSAESVRSKGFVTINPHSHRSSHPRAFLHACMHAYVFANNQGKVTETGAELSRHTRTTEERMH